MAYTKTTWTDRIVQFAMRFTKSGETSTSVTLTSDPGTVTQAGTPINAANLNKLEQGVQDAHTTADAALARSGGQMTGLITAQTGTGIALGDGGKIVDQAGNRTVVHANQDNFEVITENGSSYILQASFAGSYARFKGRQLWDTDYIRTTNGYVEWNNAGTWQGVGGVKNVQRGAATINNISPYYIDVTISAVNTSKSFVTFNVVSSNGSSATNFRLELLNSTTLRAYNINQTGSLTFSWEVVESY